MTDTHVRELLDALADTAPEPDDDELMAAVHASAGLRRVRARRSRRSLTPVLVAAATVVAVLLAVGVVSLSRQSRPSATPVAAPSEPGDAAVAAAASGRAFGELFFTQDYRTIGDYSRRVAAASTGGFRSDFVAKERQLSALTTQGRSVTRGKVLAAAARAVTPTTATVLVVADQEVRNSSIGDTSLTRRYRVAEQLRLVDGRWLVASLEPVVGGGTGGTGCSDSTATPEVDDLLRQSCTAVATLYSYDYRRLDADIAAQLAVASGQLRQEVNTTTTPALRELAPKVASVVIANVSSAAVERRAGDTATVLMFLDQSVSSTLLPQPRQDANRVEATMQRVDGRWLVSGIKAL